MLILKSDYKEDLGELVAIFKTNMGTFEADLYVTKCPETVWNFVNLAEGRQKTLRKGNFYDGLSFHRIINNFMIQGGCPFGSGTGGPGYQFKDEFDETLRHNSAGVLSMANSGIDTNGSQFFITLVPTPHLDGKHSVFGKVIKGLEIIIEIGKTAVDFADKPKNQVIIEEIIINR